MKRVKAGKDTIVRRLRPGRPRVRSRGLAGSVRRRSKNSVPPEQLAYQALLKRVRALVAKRVPRKATVLVVTKGDAALVELRCQAAWHFPRTISGEYLGYLPASSLSAVAMLEGWRAQGAEFFVIPQSSFWWLDHYEDFRRHLEARYQLVARVEDTAAIWSLTEQPKSSANKFAVQFANIASEFKRRFERDPVILNCSAGVDLEKQLPQLTIFTPPAVRGPLPYLDRTADIVVIGSHDRLGLNHARRVASAAVVQVNKRRHIASVEWRADAPSGSWPSVSIVMPCYNGRAMTDACLRSLFETIPRDVDCEVIAVDDASRDDTQSMLARWRKHDSRLKVLRNKKNLGFVDTCNLGAGHATHEILVFLNNDLALLPGWLEPLLRVFRDRADAGVCGGKLIFPDGTFQEAGGVVFRDGSAMNFGRGDPQLNAPLYSYLREVDYCSGALFATRRELFATLGGFGLEYRPGYYEDTDYCFKVRETGRKVYFQPDSAVVHREGGTAGTDVAKGMKRHQVVNQKTFAKRWKKQLLRQPIRPSGTGAATRLALSVRDPRQRRALVCALMPQCDRDAGSRRVFDMIVFLQEAGWAVTFVSQHERFEARYARALEERGIAVFGGAERSMNDLIAAGGFDLAVFGLWHIAEPFVPTLRAASPNTRIILDSIDLHFLRLARGIFLGSSGPVRALDANYGWDLVRELNTYASVDAVLTVSAKESDLINDIVADRELAHVFPQHEDLPPSRVPLAKRKGMVFVGCYRHAPNADAVEYLCKDVLPLLDPALLRRHPVYIVGDGLDDTVRALGKHLPNVRMVGWTPSVRPYVERARLAVIPLRFGAGTKRKVLESLMLGTPAVSTSIGAEGFDLRDGEHLLVADKPADFARSIEALIEDEGVWEHLARNGRKHILQSHGREAARRRLVDVVNAVMAKTPKRGLQPAANPNVLSQPAGPDDYHQLLEQIVAAVADTVPAGGTVAVVSRGDEKLLKFNGRTAWHFPQNKKREYAGHHPADSAEAIQLLEAIRKRGGEFLVLPRTGFWWLEHYEDFARHLRGTYTELVYHDAVCAIYDLRRVRRGAKQTAPIETSAAAGDVRLIAFHLPQFHPIPENDKWWGKGFTEWTNVRRATPQFPGHQQPRRPADLGYYDLRDRETRAAQAALASEHGIHAFCYYHYWFGGKRLLEQPFEEILLSGEPDFPFCLCWANEPWSRRWDGRWQDVLQSQAYSAADDLNHIRWLLPALADQRAVRVNGKPLFLVYQARDLPDPARTVETWRREVGAAGLPGLYLLTIETGRDAGWDATRAGFDGKVLFAPQFTTLFNSGARIRIPGKDKLRVFDYERAWPVLARPSPAPYRRYETVCPGWDNSPRRGDEAVVLHKSTPEAYGQWLRYAIDRARALPPENRIVFINAWNEWAEGAYLEPDVRYGRAFLEATKRALRTRAGTAKRRARS